MMVSYNPSLVITVYHHSASLVMSYVDFRDRFFSSTLTRMMNSYNLSLAITVCHHSLSLMMPIRYTQDEFFYSNLTLMKDSYVPHDHRLLSLDKPLDANL